MTEDIRAIEQHLEAAKTALVNAAVRLTTLDAAVRSSSAEDLTDFERRTLFKRISDAHDAVMKAERGVECIKLDREAAMIGGE